jgi:hypothetical protein
LVVNGWSAAHYATIVNLQEGPLKGTPQSGLENDQSSFVTIEAHLEEKDFRRRVSCNEKLYTIARSIRAADGGWAMRVAAVLATCAFVE